MRRLIANFPAGRCRPVNKTTIKGFLFVLLAFYGVSLLGQSSKGILAGVVRDTAGAAITNVKITVTSQLSGESRETTTDSIGVYRMEALNPSIYGVHVEATGFEVLDVKDLHVLASVVTSYDPQLAVGLVTTSLSVEAEGNGVNLDNGELASTISGAELTKLPIFSLNPVELLATLPGSQFINNTSLKLSGNGGQYYKVEFNGARPRANDYMLDGQDINDIGLGGQAFQPQIPDMFQSITTYTNSAPAEYGRAGGAVVNLITKAGSNYFHGSVFELYSGSGLDSLDGVTRQGKPFAVGTPNPKARFDQHQYGFTAGGPLLKDKLFAFGGTMFTRYYGETNSKTQIELPDAAGYGSIVAIGGPQSTLLQELLNGGAYLTQYQQNNAAAGPVENLNAGSQPGCPPGGCLVTTGYFVRPALAQQAPETQWFYRVDFTPREHDSFGFRYLHDRLNFLPDLPLNSSGLPGFDGQVGGYSDLGSGNWTHIFSAHLLNELRALETRISNVFTATPDALRNPASSLFNVKFGDNKLPLLGLSQNIPQGTKEDAYQYQDTVSWSRGRHSLRIGADVGRTLATLLVAQQVLGQLTFAADSNGSALANFFNNQLGVSGTATRIFGPTRIDPHSWRNAFFAQDDIRLSSELTFNAGLRYDYLSDPGNSLPYPAIDINDPFAAITNVYRIRNSSKNFGPRLGFAYAPSGVGWLGEGKTVIHGGAGIFYDTSFANIATNDAQAAPNAAAGSLQSTTANPLGNATGLISTLTSSLGPLSGVSSVDKNIENPRTYEWNLGFERALPADLKLAVNYVGSRGRKLYANQQYNYRDNSTPAAVAAGLRLNPARGPIVARANTAASEYDSLQVDVTRQLSHGLFFRAAYTYGKNLDDGSETFTLFNGPTPYSADLAPGGRRQDWSDSSFDFPQYFSVAYAWSPSGFHSANMAANAVLGALTRNFTISGITQLQAGPPSTFNLSGIDTNHDGSAANDRPLPGNRHAALDTAGNDGSNLHSVKDNSGTSYSGIHGVYYDEGFYNTTVANNAKTTGSTFVNPFKQVTADQVHWLIPYGGSEITPLEIGRNSFRNPGSTNWNVALEKDIPAPWTHLESASFQLRVEGQNVFNHNDVGILDTNVTHIGNGSLYFNRSSARISTNRNLRFWAKFTF